MGVIRFKKYWKLFLELFLTLEDGKITLDEAKRLAVKIVETFWKDQEKSKK